MVLLWLLAQTTTLRRAAVGHFRSFAAAAAAVELVDLGVRTPLEEQTEWESVRGFGTIPSTERYRKRESAEFDTTA